LPVKIFSTLAIKHAHANGPFKKTLKTTKGENLLPFRTNEGRLSFQREGEKKIDLRKNLAPP
jgi:hypothetical protein